jgi:hypothetical protein
LPAEFSLEVLERADYLAGVQCPTNFVLLPLASAFAAARGPNPFQNSGSHLPLLIRSVAMTGSSFGDASLTSFQRSAHRRDRYAERRLAGMDELVEIKVYSAKHIFDAPLIHFTVVLRQLDHFGAVEHACPTSVAGSASPNTAKKSAGVPYLDAHARQNSVPAISTPALLNSTTAAPTCSSGGR